jgi:hypothetical protein
MGYKMTPEELMELLKNLKSYKLSIEKLQSGDYLVGVLINDNYILYNESEKEPFKKYQVIDCIHNILKMKYSMDFRYLNLDSLDPICKTIAHYHYNKDSWECPVEYLYTKKNFTEDKLEEIQYKDVEDLFTI